MRKLQSLALLAAFAFALSACDKKTAESIEQKTEEAKQSMDAMAE